MLMKVRLAIGLALLAFTTTASANSLQAAAASTAAVTKGEKVYVAQKCSMCHSLDGKGQAKGPLDGIGTKLTADEIREWIVHPVEMTKKHKATRKPVMKAYPKLPKEDLDALVAFLHAKKRK